MAAAEVLCRAILVLGTTERTHATVYTRDQWYPAYGGPPELMTRCMALSRVRLDATNSFYQPIVIGTNEKDHFWGTIPTSEYLAYAANKPKAAAKKTKARSLIRTRSTPSAATRENEEIEQNDTKEKKKQRIPRVQRK
jgi:hypothetical protein